MAGECVFNQLIPPLRPVVGHVQRRDGEDCAHNIFAVHTQPNGCKLPEIAEGIVIRKSRVRERTEVVEKLKV